VIMKLHNPGCCLLEGFLRDELGNDEGETSPEVYRAGKD